MSSQPRDAVISITWSISDILEMAENTDTDPDVAVERALRWASNITDTLNSLAYEQLSEAVESDQP